jgi:hypothetical protein
MHIASPLFSTSVDLLCSYVLEYIYNLMHVLLCLLYMENYSQIKQIYIYIYIYIIIQTNGRVIIGKYEFEKMIG